MHALLRSPFTAALFTLIAITASAQNGEDEATIPPTVGERIQTLENAQTDLAPRIESARESAVESRAAQLGIPLAQLEERLRILEETQRTLARTIEILRAFEADLATPESSNDSVLPEGLLEGAPPYSIREVDKVRAEADAYALADEAAKAESALGEESVRVAVGRVRALEESLRLAKDAALSPPSDAERAALTWRVTLAQHRLDLAVAQRDLRQAMLERAELRAENIARARARIDEWAARAIDNMNLSPVHINAEWEEIFADLEAKRTEAMKSVQTIEKSLRTAEADRDQARTRLDEAADDEQRSIRQSQLTLAETQHRTAQKIYELAQVDVNWYDEVRGLWEIRRRALIPPDNEDFTEMLNTAEATPGLIESRRVAWNGDLSTVRANISRLNALIDAPPEGTGEGVLGHRRAERDSLRQREKAYADAFIRAAEVDRLATRLIEDVKRQIQSQSWVERSRAAWQSVQTAWNSELFEIDDSPVTPRKLTTALLLVIIGILVIRLVARKIIRPVSMRLFGDESLSFTIERIFFYIFLVLIVLFALRTVNIPLTVFTLFGGALALGIGLGGQTLANNFLSGLILLTDRPFKLGDVVEVDGHRGTIVNIGGRCSQLRLFNGVDVLVPNSQLIEKQVVNWTLGDNRVRFDVAVGVAYGSPTREVAKLMMRAVEEHGRILRKPEPVVLFEDFGDSALLFKVYFWIEMTTFGDARITISDIRHRIDKLFSEAKITIAFPQQDIHIKPDGPLSVQVMPGPEVTGEYSEEKTEQATLPADKED